MNIKKILLIIGFIILVFLFGLALYWVFFRTPVLPNDQVGDNFIGGQIPEVGDEGFVPVTEEDTTIDSLPLQDLLKDQVSEVANGGLTLVDQITEGEVKGLTTGSQGLQFYDKDKQQFYRVNNLGNLELLTDEKFYGVDTITWDPSNDRAILEYPDGNNILYDFRQNKQITLPQELESFSFSASGDKISAAWVGDDVSNNWIVIANDNGSGLDLIEPLGDQAHNTEIGFSPDSQVVALHRKNVGLNQQEVFPIGLHGENLRSFTVQGTGFTSQWSPEGNSLLYSVYSENTDYLPNLWVTNGQTNQLGDLKVSLNVATWPDKCSFAGEGSLYCAVPQGLPRGAGLYPEIADDYTDNFYRIDLNTGVRTLLASPVGGAGGYAAYNLFLSPDGTTLYFTDRQSGRLQSIRLE